MTNPGDAVPAGQDDIPRRIDALEKALAAQGASIAQSFNSSVASIQAALTAATTALAAQVLPVVTHQSTVSFGMPGGDFEILRSTISTPAGYTRAVITCIGNLTAYNPGGSGDFLRGVIDINGASTGQSMAASANPEAAISPASSVLLSGLSSGVTFYARMVAGSGIGWAAHALNRATIDTTVIFLK